MLLKKKDRALLIKLFYQNGSYSLASLIEYRCLKEMRKGSISKNGLKNMIKKFEDLEIWVWHQEGPDGRYPWKLLTKLLLFLTVQHAPKIRHSVLVRWHVICPFPGLLFEKYCDVFYASIPTRSVWCNN